MHIIRAYLELRRGSVTFIDAKNGIVEPGSNLDQVFVISLHSIPFWKDGESTSLHSVPSPDILVKIVLLLVWFAEKKVGESELWETTLP